MPSIGEKTVTSPHGLPLQSTSPTPVSSVKAKSAADLCGPFCRLSTSANVGQPGCAAVRTGGARTQSISRADEVGGEDVGGAVTLTVALPIASPIEAVTLIVLGGTPDAAMVV